MTDKEEAGSSRRPEITIEPTKILGADSPSVVTVANEPLVTVRPSGQSLGDNISALPRGLTEDGRVEFARLIEEDMQRQTRRLGHELMRQWLSLNVDGPESFTWDRVRNAHAALHENDRREVIGEVRAKLRAEVVDELQQTNDLRAAQAKRATRRWVGSGLITISIATAAVLTIPGDHILVKLVLFGGSVIGTVVDRPRR